MEYTQVSRQKSEDCITYEELTEELMASHLMIINTTPLGTYPNTENCPLIPYEWVTRKHYLYDLVYNPAETLFLKNGAERGAATQNGLKMLELQAEKAWEIWTTEDNLWSV